MPQTEKHTALNNYRTSFMYPYCYEKGSYSSNSRSKELCVESSKSGYTYFGARYYDADLSLWLSVDPLSDMYPSTSPFMYVRGNAINLIDPYGLSDRPPKKGKKPRQKRIKYGDRKMGSGQKLKWRDKKGKRSPSGVWANTKGKRQRISTGVHRTSGWENVGTGGDGRNSHNLTRGLGQDYLRSLRVVNTEGSNGGVQGTAITTGGGFPMDGMLRKVSLGGSGMVYSGFIPLLGQVTWSLMEGWGFLSSKPNVQSAGFLAPLAYFLNVQRVNTCFRDVQSVNVFRTSANVSGNYMLQARYRQFNQKPIDKRNFIVRWWYGKL